MFKRHKHSTKHRVYELDVWGPPVGMVYNHLNGEWEERPVYKRSSNKKEQYWERLQPDFDYKRKRKQELERQVYNPEYVDPQLEAYRMEEWDRRFNGFWFMNNGVPTYITGTHYFYIQWWRLDGGYPDFRMVDRDFFLMWKYIEDDPDCYGLIEATSRRSGKTYRASCCLYEYISRKKFAQGGIQSKTDSDAASVFEKTILSWVALPDFFKPKANLPKGRRPKNELEFNDPKNDNLSLESQINFKSSGILAYDSQKLQRYIRDECGKMPHIDVYEGWQVVKPTLRVGTKNIIGKAIYTTTVEEGGSERFKLLWKGSNPNERPAINRTRTGLYRLFTPSYKNDADYIDKYGVCDEEASKEAQLEIRESLQDDPHELAGEIRKNPFTIEEAFYSISDDTIFDSVKITKQIQALSYESEDNLVQVGDFRWKNEEQDTEVEFIPNSKGRFKLHRNVDVENELLWNNVRKGVKTRPMNQYSMVAGCDPFDHRLEDVDDKKRASKGAGYVFHKFDGLNDDLSETFLCEYLARPPEPYTFFEEMIMMCHYFGCKILPESNKSGIVNYFEDRGYGHWIIKDSKGRKGISAQTQQKEWMAGYMSRYIAKSCHKITFKSLLIDLNNFDIADSRKNDATMGAGWALVAAYRLDKSSRKNRKPKRQRGSNREKATPKSKLLKYL